MEKKKRKNPTWLKEWQFGQPGAAKPGAPAAGTRQREFYRWCEEEATEEDLNRYMNTVDNPASRRRFIRCLLQCNKVQDFFDLTNQIHGAPKQTIENITPPVVNIVLE